MTLLRVAIVACGIALATHAQAYSDLFVFGDSLSDMGNTSERTDVWWLPFVPQYPGAAYYQGRFSNGPVYSELLADQLGIAEFARSTAGGNNFASGGGRTSGTGGLEGPFIEDLDEQVDDFIANRNPDAQALYLVWAGANDIILGGQTDMSVPVTNVAGEIERLYLDGGRQFLVLNLPKLGATPSYSNSAAQIAQYNAYTTSFNSALTSALDTLEGALLGIDLLRFDIETLFDQVIANPGDYGLANVTESAAPGIEAGDSDYNPSQIVSNPDEYLFWDGVHPTRVMHAALADALFDFLTAPPVLPGDFNNDGLVDLADYTLWRDNLGAADDALISRAGDDVLGIGVGDYQVWREHFGQRAGSSPIPVAPQTAAVPEPRAIVLLIAAMVSLGRLYRH